MDWSIEVGGSISSFGVCVTSGSLCMGLCYYINGMVADLKSRMESVSELTRNAYQRRAWPIYVKEIDFHAEIIEYFEFFRS